MPDDFDAFEMKCRAWAALMTQDEIWMTGERIEYMTPEHCANAVRMLERSKTTIVTWYSYGVLFGWPSCPYGEPMGDAEEDVLNNFMDTPDDVLFEDAKLVKALRARAGDPERHDFWAVQ